MAGPSTTPVAGPVTASERIVSLDILRGFAVLGILIMNIQSFSMIGIVYLNPTAWGNFEGANRAIWLASHILADRKFMTIFSLLFGAGIILMTRRAEAAGQSPTGTHYRRMFILMGFGLAHAHLLWYGDILFSYAVCGCLAYLFRRKKPRTLIIFAVVGLLVPTTIAMLGQWTLPHWSQEGRAYGWWTPGPETIAGEIETYRSGWLKQFEHRTINALFFESLVLLTENIWRTTGLMLIGMALFKTRWLDASRSTRTYATAIAVAVVVGIPIVAWGAIHNLRNDFHFETSFFVGSQFNYWGSLLVAAGWIGLITLICKHHVAGAVTAALADVGRLAFTNYLLQTVICTTIFYGHGLGWFARVERPNQIMIVLAVWIILIVFSKLWLKFFRFGPAEWLWRSLTYGKRQAMRRTAST